MSPITRLVSRMRAAGPGRLPYGTRHAQVVSGLAAALVLGSAFGVASIGQPTADQRPSAHDDHSTREIASAHESPARDDPAARGTAPAPRQADPGPRDGQSTSQDARSAPEHAEAAAEAAESPARDSDSGTHPREAGADSRAAAAEPPSAEAEHATPPATDQIDQWINEATTVLKKHGYTDEQIDKHAIRTIIENESGGDPTVVNNWDSNAAAGIPSQGLMQTIPPTFESYALPGHGDILDPVDNIIAGTRYSIDRYGSLSAVPGVSGMRSGGSYLGY